MSAPDWWLPNITNSLPLCIITPPALSLARHSGKVRGVNVSFSPLETIFWSLNLHILPIVRAWSWISRSLRYCWPRGLPLCTGETADCLWRSMAILVLRSRPPATSLSDNNKNLSEDSQYNTVYWPGKSSTINSFWRRHGWTWPTTFKGML